MGHLGSAGTSQANGRPGRQQCPHGHLLGSRAAHRGIRAGWKGKGGVREGVVSPTRWGFVQTARTRILLEEPLPNAGILRRVGDFADAICKIGGPSKSPDTVWNIPGEIADSVCKIRARTCPRFITCSTKARAFYEEEAIRGGWSVPQLDRQISTQFFERALHSKNPQALLARARTPQQEDLLPVESEIRDPYLLEFLNLKDEYSEANLEDALIHHLEWFLLEMGAGFAFVARQKRIRIGGSPANCR
ncbi:MAG: YhcG family protein [Elusimicrobia bacterium]|nr:YhcG family protein [Elusimicrobiota bacterium]